MTVIQVRRDVYSPDATLGRMLLGGVFECWTMEPPAHRPGMEKPYAIPSGTYNYYVGPSARLEEMAARDPNFKAYDVIHVENVPGFTNIEVHPGNFVGDTHGCTLVGDNRNIAPPELTQSDAAFAAMMAKVTPQGVISFA